MGILANIRIIVYFILTAAWFVVSFTPQTLYVYWTMVISSDLIFFLVLPLIIPILHFITIFVFSLVHAKIIRNLFLPKLQPGIYARSSDLARLQAVRLTSHMIAQGLVGLFNFIPFLNTLFLRAAVYRIYGAKIGKGVIISNGTSLDSELTEIGDKIIIGLKAVLSCHIVEDFDRLVIGPVRIGNNVTIGGGSIVAPGASIGENVILGVNSFVLKNQELSANAVWGGSPAKKIKDLDIVDS